MALNCYVVVAKGNQAVPCSVSWNTMLTSSLHCTPLQLPPLIFCKFCTNIKRSYKRNLNFFLNGRVSRNLIGDVGTLSGPLSQYISVAWCWHHRSWLCLDKERVYFRVLWILPIKSVFIVYFFSLFLYSLFSLL